MEISEQLRNFKRDLKSDINHHQAWRGVHVSLYVLLTVTFIGCGISATIFAGQGVSECAAWLAGASTAAGTLERSLRIRERWVDHLKRYTELRNLMIKVEHGTIQDSKIAVKEYELITTDYAQNIPMDGRDDFSGSAKGVGA